MSRNGKNPRMELKVNITPPRATNQGGVAAGSSPKSGASSPSSSASSSPSSCVSSEAEAGPDLGSMVLARCPRCLMYVMLSEKDPRCPKCKSSTVLLDFHDKNGGHGGRSKGSGMS